MHGVKTTAAILARRVQALDVELALIDAQIAPLVKAAAPALLDVFGVGIDTAAVLFVTAGDNPERIVSEAKWAMLCGIAPVPATSGLMDGRYRLNHAGDRQANNAIWRIVITRLGQHEPRTVAYMERRPGRGQIEALHHSLSQALRRPGDLPGATALTKNAVTGLAPELPDTLGLSFERHAVPSPHTTAGPWPDKSLPSPEWPITGLPETPATSTLTNIGASIGTASVLALRVVPSTVIDLVFRVWGARLSPEEVTLATGITPARSFRVGEMRGAAAKRVAGWEWRSAKGDDDEALMQTLLRDLGPHTALFRRCHEEGAMLSLTVVGVIRGDLVESWEEAERRKIDAENGDRFRRFLDADRVGVSLSDAAIQFLAAVGELRDAHRR